MASADAVTFPDAAPPERRARESLTAAGSGAAVDLQPLSGDASTRVYFRARGADGGTCVVAVYPEPFAPGELPFLAVRDLLESWSVPVPAVLGSDGRRGVVVLEDLGDVTLQEELRGAPAGLVEDRYREAVGQLLRFQREAARARRQAACFEIAFDVEKLSWELHYFEKHFLEGLRGCELSVEDRTRLAEGFHRLAAEIASWPRVLCHRDYHSRNLMAHRGRLVWIDFQDARMGPVTYDMASLLRDSYVELDEDLVEARLEEFRDAAGADEPRTSFRRRFDLTAVQRSLKALGTFGFMATVRGNSVYLPYIPRALAGARRGLAAYPELGDLRRALARHLEELG